MDAPYSPDRRAERLIAAGRVVLAASSLFAVWLDPTEPAKFASIAYSLLVAYVVYSTAMALIVERFAAPSKAFRVITHAFDLAFFSLFTYFTSGPASSPFIAYFVFSLVCATLRWQWRGTFWTALVALATFLGLGVYFTEVLHDPMMNLQSFIIRAVYLVVFAVLLGYLGAHEQRIRGEMTMLAAWPDPAGQTANEVIRDLLIAATRVVATPRAVAVWIESEEPWLYVAAWVDGGFTFTREAPTTFEPLVATALAGRGFLCADAHANPAVVLVSHDGQLERWRGAVALHPDLVERYVRGPLLALPLAGGTLEGLLLLSGRPGLTADELVLGEIVAGLVGDRLDRFNLTQRLRATAASEERVRLGRDLHDGVLQSFTGIGLRLAATRRRAEESPRQLGEDLLQLQRLVTDEQRDLRFFIRELTSSPVDDDGTEQHLTARLGELAQRIEQVWGLRLRLESAAVPADLAPDRAREIYNLVREAVINAARHGAAGVVEVSVRPATAGWLAITVRDDGRGFPFTGRFTLKQLAECGVGPRTLRERIAALGGELWIDSQASGSTIEMRLPRESTPA